MHIYSVHNLIFPQLIVQLWNTGNNIIHWEERATIKWPGSNYYILITSFLEMFIVKKMKEERFTRSKKDGLIYSDEECAFGRPEMPHWEQIILEKIISVWLLRMDNYIMANIHSSFIIKFICCTSYCWSDSHAFTQCKSCKYLEVCL